MREADALWSKDGQRVAYLSDEGGAQALLIRDAAGLEKPVRHALGKTGYFTLLAGRPTAGASSSTTTICTCMPSISAAMR